MCQRTDNIKKIKELKNDNNEVKEENKDIHQIRAQTNENIINIELFSFKPFILFCKLSNFSREDMSISFTINSYFFYISYLFLLFYYFHFFFSLIYPLIFLF